MKGKVNVMKKTLLSASVLLLLCVLVLAAFVGCDASDPKPYVIRMENEEWLYEEIPSSANAGETVTVRITKDPNVGMYAFLVNGDQVGEDSDSQNEKYWQFSFVMPNEDITIEFETHQHPDPGLEKECEFSVQYVRTDGYHDGVCYPIVTAIRSSSELNAYYEANKDKYSLERRTGTIYSDSTIGFLDACDKYTEEYFESQILLMILLEEGSGSIRHKVERVAANEAGIAVDITTIVPEVGTDDMAEWHILIELEAGVYADDEDAVTVFLNGRDVTPKETTNEKNEFLEKAEEIKEYSETHLKAAETQYEMNTESGIVREKWDELLSEVHNSLEKHLSESDCKKLQENETEWILEKEKAINDAAEEWKGGSGEPMARNMAAIRCMEERFVYLISML